MAPKSLRRTWSTVRLAAEFIIVIVLTGLDIRDLNYKINWLGPHINYRFAAVGPNVLQPVDLQLAINMTTPGMLMRRPNGWSSFLDKCSTLSPVARAKTFRSLMGRNCTVGSSAANVTYERLVMAGSVRVDSVAWACCQLLEPNRQPPVCNSPAVHDFDRRYYMEPVPVPAGWVAARGTDAEAELLNLLGVIGMSAPLNAVTCVEGFEFVAEGQYYATVFGCGSPTYFRSAFAGHFATKLRELHQDKAYLTVDNINLMGFHFMVRENCVSDFKVAMNNATGVLGITHTTTINFSSYGQLYALMIVIDVILAVVNLASALQLGFSTVLPAFLSKAPSAEESFAREEYASFMTSSLYRSPIVMALLVVSQLSSWLIIIPNSVMWTWGNSQAAKVQAYLSSIRTWTLILIVVNNVWDLFVFFHERLAFWVSQHTFLMSAEIIAVGAYVSYYNRLKMFAIADAKYAVELQRSSDATSFKNFTGACNAFNGDLDHQVNTPTNILWIVYKPFFTILWYSVVAIFVYALIKCIIICSLPFLARRLFKKEMFVITDTDRYAVSSCEDTAPGEDEDKPPAPLTKDDSRVSATHSFGVTHLHRFGKAENSVAEKSFTVPAVSPPLSPNSALRRRGYARLPLEELLNTPIRARSLVRTTVSLNHVVNRQNFVSAKLYLEFGVFFVAGRMKPRWGFLNPVPPIIQVTNVVISDLVEPMTPEDQLSRLRPATAGKTN